MVSVSNNKKCVSLSNQKCMTEPTFINLHPFAINLGRCVGSCNTLNDLPNKVCIPSKTGDLNLSVFNTITGINESSVLTKHISCECICKFDGRKCNSDQKLKSNKCQCEWEKHHIHEKGYIWTPATCSCENSKYLASIIDDLVINCDKVIDAAAKSCNKETKSVTTNLNEKNAICKTKNFDILLAFLFMIIALLIAVSIYC